MQIIALLRKEFCYPEDENVFDSPYFASKIAPFQGAYGDCFSRLVASRPVSQVKSGAAPCPLEVAAQYFSKAPEEPR